MVLMFHQIFIVATVSMFLSVGAISQWLSSPPPCMHALKKSNRKNQENQNFIQSDLFCFIKSKSSCLRID